MISSHIFTREQSWKPALYLERTTGTVFQKSLPVVQSIKPLLPQYHTRAMRKSLLSKYGCVSSGIKLAMLRPFYKNLTGDSCAASNLTEVEIDERVQLILDMKPEDPNTVVV